MRGGGNGLGSAKVRCLYLVFLKVFIYLFLERGEGREEERERNINVWLPLMWPPPGLQPATQACALIGELNQQPFGLQPMLNPLS